MIAKYGDGTTKELEEVPVTTYMMEKAVADTCKKVRQHFGAGFIQEVGLRSQYHIVLIASH